MKFSPDGGEVEIRVRGVDDGLAVSVEDHGIGIAKADRARIFERFYKADRARARGGGTGLGLAIARHVVEGHGGTIRVESQEGVGSTFTVTLPARGRRPGRRTRPDRWTASTSPRSTSATSRTAGTSACRCCSPTWPRSSRTSRSPGGGLPDPAGPAPGRRGRGPLRGAPRVGGAAGVRQRAPRQGAAGGERPSERLDLGADAVRAPGDRAAAGRRAARVRRHPPPPRPGRRGVRDQQAEALLAWLDGTPPSTTRWWWSATSTPSPSSPPRRGCGRPASRSAYAQANGAEPGGHVAVRHRRRGDGHRRRPRLPRLRLGPRRGPGRARAGSPWTGPRSATRPSTRRITWGSSREVGRVTGSARAAPLRLAHRGDWRVAPGEHARRVRGRDADPRLRRRGVRRPRWRRRRPGRCSTTTPWPGSSAGRAGSTGSTAASSAAAGVPRLDEVARRAPAAPGWTSSSRATTTATPPPTVLREARGERPADAVISSFDPPALAAMPTGSRAGAAGSTRSTSARRRCRSRVGAGLPRRSRSLWGAITPASWRRARRRARGRGVDGAPPRDRGDRLGRAWASSPAAWRPRRWARGRRRTRERRPARRARRSRPSRRPRGGERWPRGRAPSAARSSARATRRRSGGRPPAP